MEGEYNKWLNKYIDNRIACKYLGMGSVAAFNKEDLSKCPFSLLSTKYFMIPKGFSRFEYQVDQEFLDECKECFDMLCKRERKQFK
jgi:hypothetical protein